MHMKSVVINDQNHYFDDTFIEKSSCHFAKK